MSRPTHPAYKTRNRPADNAALRRCGLLTIWFDRAMTWEAAPTGKRGRQPDDSDAAIRTWLRAERALLSRHAKVAKAIDYLLSSEHWPGFTRFFEDGRICLSKNCAERSLRSVALGRKSWLFAGSARGGQRAAFMYTLIGTAKLDGIDPQAWLADGIARISDAPVSRLPEMPPWAWKTPKLNVKAA